MAMSFSHIYVFRDEHFRNCHCSNVMVLMSKANTRIKNERKLFADAIDTKNVHVKFTSHKSAIIAYEKKNAAWRATKES